MADVADPSEPKAPARDDEWHDYSVIGSFEELAHSVEAVLQGGCTTAAAHLITSGETRAHRAFVAPATSSISPCDRELCNAPRESLLSSLLGLSCPLVLLLPVEYGSDVWGTLTRNHSHSLLSAGLCAREHVRTRARTHGEPEPSIAILASIGAPSHGGYIGHAITQGGMESFIHVWGSVDDHMAAGRYSSSPAFTPSEGPVFKLDTPAWAGVDPIIRSGRDVMHALGPAPDVCTSAQLVWHAQVGQLSLRIHARFKSCEGVPSDGFFDRLAGPTHALSVWDLTRPGAHICVASGAPVVDAGGHRYAAGADDSTYDDMRFKLGAWATGAAAVALAFNALHDSDDLNRERFATSSRVTVAQIQALGDDTGVAARAWQALLAPSAGEVEPEPRVFSLMRNQSAAAFSATFAASLEPVQPVDDSMRARVKRAIDTVAPESGASRCVNLVDLEQSLGEVTQDISDVQYFCDDFVDAYVTLCATVCSRALKLSHSQTLQTADGLLRYLQPAARDAAVPLVGGDPTIGRTMAGIATFLYTRLIQRLREQFETAVSAAAGDVPGDADADATDHAPPPPPAAISTDAALQTQRFGLLAHALHAVKYGRAHTRARARARAQWRARPGAAASPRVDDTRASTSSPSSVIYDSDDDDMFHDVSAVAADVETDSTPSAAAAAAAHRCALTTVRVWSTHVHDDDGARWCVPPRVLIGPLLSDEAGIAADADTATVDVRLMVEPELCDAPPASVETIATDAVMMNHLSLSDLRSHLRPHLSVELLRADMCVFKAANEGAHMVDFLRWCFPQSWCTTQHDSVSIVMQREGHVNIEALSAACGYIAVATEFGDRYELFAPVQLPNQTVRWDHATSTVPASSSVSTPMSFKAWHAVSALWDSAHALPRACVPLLWNPQAVGETVLTALEGETAAEVVAHLCAAVFKAAADECNTALDNVAVGDCDATRAVAAQATAVRAVVGKELDSVNTNMALDESDATGTGTILRSGRAALARVLHVLTRTRDAKLLNAPVASGVDADDDTADSLFESCVEDMSKALEMSAHTRSLRLLRQSHARTAAADCVRLAALTARVKDASQLALKAVTTYASMCDYPTGASAPGAGATVMQRSLVDAIALHADGAAATPVARIAAHSFGLRSSSYAALGGREHDAPSCIVLTDGAPVADTSPRMWAAAVVSNILGAEPHAHDDIGGPAVTNKSDRGRGRAARWESVPLPASTYTLWTAITNHATEEPIVEYATSWDEPEATNAASSASTAPAAAAREEAIGPCACATGHTRACRSMSALIPGPTLLADGALTFVASMHTNGGPVRR